MEEVAAAKLCLNFRLGFWDTGLPQAGTLGLASTAASKGGGGDSSSTGSKPKLAKAPGTTAAGAVGWLDNLELAWLLRVSLASIRSPSENLLSILQRNSH